jgi:hypothetical protein
VFELEISDLFLFIFGFRGQVAPKVPMNQRGLAGKCPLLTPPTNQP